MAASDSPPIGLSHPTVDPTPSDVTQGQSEQCRCTDCGYTVEITADVPLTCPDCGGALTRVSSE